MKKWTPTVPNRISDPTRLFLTYGEPYGSRSTSWMEFPVDKVLFINMIRIGRDGSQYKQFIYITNVEVIFADKY